MTAGAAAGCPRAGAPLTRAPRSAYAGAGLLGHHRVPHLLATSSAAAYPVAKGCLEAAARVFAVREARWPRAVGRRRNAHTAGIAASDGCL